MMSLAISPDPLTSPEATSLAPRPSLSDSVNIIPPLPAASGELYRDVISNGAFSKTWVLPPRKKPGRKAANDVPPTKRQAQNRAAQKAFRDRKAMRVVELEKENDELRERIDRMEAELNVLRTAASSEFQNKQPQSTMEQQLVSPAPSGGVNCETCVVGKDCTCLNDVVSESSAPIPLPSTSSKSPGKSSEDRCGLCSLNSCLCEDLGIRSSSSHPSEGSSPHPPTHGAKRKRPKSPSSPLAPSLESYPMEIDFTSSFINTLSSSTQRDSLPNDGCGFCSNGTPCVCLSNTLPRLQSYVSVVAPEAHPDVIRRDGGRRQNGDVEILDELVPPVGSPMTIASGNVGCTGKPGGPQNSTQFLIVGTCSQCRSDPMSTLFCQTLSKKLETPVSSIRSPPVPTKRPSTKSSKETSDTYLPCSAVYQTISRHRNFNNMSLEVIVNGLANRDHRGMQFSVDSVQGILKEMDSGEIVPDK